MFKFSCFNTHTQSHKQKKMVNLSAEAMRKTIEDSSRNDAQTYLTDANSSNLKVVVDNLKSSVDCPIETGAVEGHSNSDEVESVPDIPVLKIAHIKKSHSLGTGLDMEGRDSGGSASEDGINQNFSSDGSHANCGSHVQNEGKGLVTSLHNQFQDGHPSDSLLVHDDVGNHESVFSIGDAPHSEKDSPANLNDVQFSGEANSGDHTPCTPVFEKSSSLPNIDSPVHLTVCSLRHIRSAEDLSVLDSRRKEMRTHKLASQIVRYPGKDNTLISSYDKDHSSKPVDDSCGNYNYFASAKDWIIPSGDEVNVNDNLGGNSSFYHGAELPSKDFKVKRIEEWVTDLQNFSPLDESDALSPLDDHTDPAKKGVQDVLPATKLEGNKFSPGMEAVKKYISSLSPSATSAQLVNFGLAVIPFLSPLSGLKALNLSGNAIVRIAAGSLPRGLHILNLSKNKISTVEGLRELTRLRVLDLSYNRILRIGHGLASCSSLKEVYLAGNKISEVEGLHRLLKLNVLDLRFNKISTTKCLGQLAANYNSLQAISLEGNPVQKNVGDEQVKKYLQSLLPHLTYFNRQSMKVGTLKDSTDRSARLAIGAHQMDRGIKDLKLMRKATHTSAPSKASPSSSTHGRRSQAAAAAAAAMAKSSKGRHARLPPSGTRPGVQPSPLNGPSNPHLSLKSDSSMRRSRSEGTLGAL